MKIFFSEGIPEYNSYTFNYGIYCVMEDQSELPEIYAQGFLPYSGSTTLEYQVFYLARSLRVDLDRFADSSENRRVDRKISELNISMQCMEKEAILKEDTAFLPFAHEYARKRIGDSMPEERLQYIIRQSIGSHIFRFMQADQTIGYVLACIKKNMLHYWFSFFDTELMRSHSLGKWMMWKVVRWASDQNLEHVYLGTCYGTKSLYKVRDHKGLSFYDGTGWNQDSKLLKSWCKSDQDRNNGDRFKGKIDQNELIKAVLNR